jgi:hypothetical protein
MYLLIIITGSSGRARATTSAIESTHGFCAIVFNIGYEDKKGFLILNTDLTELKKAALFKLFGPKVHGIHYFKNVLHTPLPDNLFTFSQGYFVNVVEIQYGRIDAMFVLEEVMDLLGAACNEESNVNDLPTEGFEQEERDLEMKLMEDDGSNWKRVLGRELGTDLESEDFWSLDSVVMEIMDAE